MYARILSMVAAVALVAACETPADTSAQASGTGGGGAAPTAQAPQSAPQAVQPAPGSQEDLVVNVGDRVFFDFDKYNLKPEARASLEKQAAWLKRYPANQISIEGHCDERGTREYNLALGERRANAAKDYLVALGIAPARIRTISYGKERPVALGSNEAAWAQNRRAVTVVRAAGA